MHTATRSAMDPSLSLSRFEQAVVRVDVDAPVVHAAREMRDHRVGCVIVTRRGDVAGILTDRDLTVRVLAEGRDPGQTSAGEVMSYLEATLSPSDTVETALRRMREHGVRRVPIVDADGAVRGIVTADDLLVLLGAQLSDLGAAVAENADASESR